MWPKWPKEGFHAPQWRKRNIWSGNLARMSEKRTSEELSFLGIKKWRVLRKVTRQWFMKITQTAAFLARTVQYRIRRHAWGPKELVYLYLNGHHLGLERHPRHLVRMTELKILKPMVCHPDMCIYILLFRTLNFSILMHMPRISSTIKVLFQICSLMKDHPLVSTLSAAG